MATSTFAKPSRGIPFVTIVTSFTFLTCLVFLARVAGFSSQTHFTIGDTELLADTLFFVDLAFMFLVGAIALRKLNVIRDLQYRGLAKILTCLVAFIVLYWLAKHDLSHAKWILSWLG